jgi:CRP-like cAMP-binding protein
MSSTAKILMQNLAGAPLAGWEDLACQCEVLTFEAQETVFSQGQSCPFVYVVRTGLLKSVYFSEDGAGWVKSFTSEGGFIASLAALNLGGATSFSMVALERTIVERFPYAKLRAMAETRLDWSIMLTNALFGFAAAKEERERTLLTLSPEARYRAVMARTDRLEDRVSQKDLAAWLGVTPVGLNRIIKRVRGRSAHSVQGLA